MSQPKPWERQQTKINSAPAEEIIAPSDNSMGPVQPPIGGAPGLEGGLTSPTTGDPSAALDGGVTSTASPATGMSGYGGGLGGGGMYGGMGGMGMMGRGMYGGMGGMGMMGGMGGMYGGMGGMGMDGQQGNWMMRAQMYIYQLCEIAQMVEMSSHSLAGFYTTLKNVSAAAYSTGKEWSIWLIKYLIDTFKRLKEWLQNRYQAYFIRKDLTKEELESQVRITRYATKAFLLFVGINLIRVFVRIIKFKRSSLF